MSRPLRPLGAGFLYHVTSRGNDGQLIFSDAVARELFVDRLNAVAAHRRWSLLAYCLMGNHIHIALETKKANLGDGMRDILSHYARRRNARRQRTGHLFGGRYHSQVIESDSHLFSTIRYIARNPVAAGLVRSAAAWPWSSYSGIVGTAPVLVTLDTDFLFGLFHHSRRQARARLVELVEAAEPPSYSIPPSTREPTSIATLIQLLGHVDGIQAAVALGYRHLDIAQALGIARSTVSNRLRRDFPPDGG